MATTYHTVQEFIDSNSGSKSVSYHNFSILDQKTINDEIIQFIDSNLIDDYMDELKSVIVNVQLSNKELLKYSYNPGLLAYDIYGSVELEFVILKLNGIIDPKDFDFPTIKLIQISSMEEILSNIYNAERRYIQQNREINGIELA